MTYYVGIDVGLTGAVALLDTQGKYMAVHDIPIMARGKATGKVKNCINPAALAGMLVELFTLASNHWRATKPLITDVDVFCVFEQVSAMPGQGVSSVFSLGDTFGCVRGVVACLEFQSKSISPVSWKKYFKIPSDKEVARALAINLFPKAPLSRKKDHNRAEALLIARYAWENQL